MSVREEEHFSGKVAQKALIVSEGKVLLVQDPRDAQPVWELPGGRMNVGEEPRAALAREIEEELGVRVHVGSVVHLQQFLQGSEGARALVIVYEASLADPNAHFTLAEGEVSAVAWLAPHELDDIPLYAEYKAAIEAYFS